MANSKWTAIPALRSNSIGLQKRFYLIIGILGVIAITGPIALLVALGSKPVVETIPQESGIGEYAVVAKIAAQDWLAGRKTSVPLSPGLDGSFNQNGQIMEPMPYFSLDFYKSEPSYDLGRTYNLNYFMLVTKSTSYRVVVTTETLGNVTTVVAAPSIEMTTYSENVSDPYDYLNHDEANQGISDQAIATSVYNWAEAFVSNDTEGLKSIVNDNNDYRGMDGFTLVGKPLIVSSLPDTTTSYYIRVKLLISPSSAKLLKLSVDYDLLVIAEGKEIPHVVAWGPAGSAPLTPYQNRITN
jgi:hypothetical protein